jgi:MbtH protein
VANPFEDENGVYHVLINDEGQHSLWPTFVDVPKGWKIIHSDDRAACLEFINRNWTDMRPNSLIKKMNEASASEQNLKDQPEQAPPTEGSLPSATPRQSTNKDTKVSDVVARAKP